MSATIQAHEASVLDCASEARVAANTKDMTGQRFGALVVLDRAGRSPGRLALWCVQCDCGTVKVTDGHTLRSGRARSCGCRRGASLIQRAKDARSRPGYTQVPEYRCWTAMVSRCHNPSDQAFGRYGGAGITVCKEWRESFAAFLGAMGPRPSRRHTLDRLDNAQCYGPGSVRWATDLEQQRNRTNHRRIEWNGETLILSEWSERTGLSRHVIAGRLEHGWSVSAALSVPAQPRHKRGA